MVFVADWPTGATASPAGTSFRVRNCTAEQARVVARLGGSVQQEFRLMPQDRIGQSVFVARGTAMELWVYYLNGTPLNWNGGFHGFIQGSSAPQADVTLGYCG